VGRRYQSASTGLTSRQRRYGALLRLANGGTGITSCGSGIPDFLGTPSSANLATAVTDETGSGALVFATGPTITGMTLAGAVTGADQTVSAINLKDYGEITNALGNVTGATSIDLTDGNSVTATVTGAVTWTFSNPTASDEMCGFSLKLVRWRFGSTNLACFGRLAFCYCSDFNGFRYRRFSVFYG
jgi:hypothetical protein